jgi:hypothetical protein
MSEKSRPGQPQREIPGNKAKGPQIAVNFLRNEAGNIDRIQLAPFEPGMVIRRCGKRYQVDAKGQQRRIE